FFKSIDAGATWQAVPVPVTSALLGVDYATETTLVAVGEGGAALRSGDGGATWSKRTTPVTAALRAVDMADARNGVAVGDRGTVLRTINGGATWRIGRAPTGARLTSVSMLDAANGWATGGGIVLRTTDGGASWTRHVAPTTARLSGVSVVAGRLGWVVGGGGTVLRGSVVGANPFASAAGSVVDAATGGNISGAKLKIGSAYAAPSAVDGSFIAARLVPGVFSVRFTHPSYVTRTVTNVALWAGLRSPVHVAMTPKTITRLTRPSIDSTAPSTATTVTITTTMTPSACATVAPTTLTAVHWESKLVTKRVHGKLKRVRVWYWRTRFAVTMTPEPSGRLTTSRRLTVAGTWRLRAAYSGSGTTMPSTSYMRELKVVTPPAPATAARISP
ncbi:MAG: hypothetical protein HGB10_11785, partial [Coriobacteriia bacterium]|nr:hypothetical protein [Coriobacteriia bacterium]